MAAELVDKWLGGQLNDDEVQKMRIQIQNDIRKKEKLLSQFLKENLPDFKANDNLHESLLKLQSLKELEVQESLEEAKESKEVKGLTKNIDQLVHLLNTVTDEQKLVVQLNNDEWIGITMEQFVWKMKEVLDPLLRGKNEYQVARKENQVLVVFRRKQEKIEVNSGWEDDIIDIEEEPEAGQDLFALFQVLVFITESVFKEADNQSFILKEVITFFLSYEPSLVEKLKEFPHDIVKGLIEGREIQQLQSQKKASLLQIFRELNRQLVEERALEEEKVKEQIGEWLKGFEEEKKKDEFKSLIAGIMEVIQMNKDGKEEKFKDGIVEVLCHEDFYPLIDDQSLNMIMAI